MNWTGTTACTSSTADTPTLEQMKATCKKLAEIAKRMRESECETDRKMGVIQGTTKILLSSIKADDLRAMPREDLIAAINECQRRAAEENLRKYIEGTEQIGLAFPLVKHGVT